MIDMLQFLIMKEQSFDQVVVRREDDFMFDFDEPSRGKRRVSTQWNWVANTNHSQKNWVVSTILSIILWDNKHPFSVEPELGGQQPFSILSAILG